MVVLNTLLFQIEDARKLRKRNDFKKGKKVVVIYLQIISEFCRKFDNNWFGSLDDYLDELNDPLNMKKPQSKRMRNTTSSVDHHNFKTFGNILKYITLRDKKNHVESCFENGGTSAGGGGAQKYKKQHIFYVQQHIPK